MIFMGLGNLRDACTDNCSTSVYSDDEYNACIATCFQNGSAPSSSTPSNVPSAPSATPTASTLGSYFKNPWVLLGLAAAIGGGIYFFVKR